MTRRIVMVDPLPRTLDLIMTPDVRRRLEALGDVVVSEERPMPDDEVRRLLPEAILLFGQTALPRERLDRAPHLKAIFNVETNFLPNVDYGACAERGIPVLTPGSAFAAPVAEAALGMALDLCRGITAADRAFRAGTEAYGLEGNADTIRFGGATVGILGFGDLGRTLRELIRPFGNLVRVYDPWLPAAAVERQGCVPAGLEETLRESRIVFVLASATAENEGFIGAHEFGLMRPGSAFLLLSRAAVVDFSAMLEAARSGHLRVATDVFPVEPVPAADPVRRIPNLLLSAHRTGGTRDAFL